MIFFIYWKATPDAPWTIYGAYEDKDTAESRIGQLFGEGFQARIAL